MFVFNKLALMKLWSLLFSLLFFSLLKAQNYTDTVAALGVPLNSDALKIQAKAQKMEKKAMPERKKWQKALLNIKELEAEAQATSKAKKKKKILVKVLKKKKKAEVLHRKYLQKVEGANLAYFKLFQELYKLSPQVHDPVAVELVESLEGHALKKAKKAKSKRKKAERVGDNLVKMDELLDAYEAEQNAIGDLVYAIKVRNGDVEVVQPEELVAEVVEKPQYEAATMIDELRNVTAPQDVDFQEINVIYKVQIAASREELTTEKLLEIYSPKSGERIFSEIEDEWYKYAVGRFHSYAEALAYKNEIGVEGAFVIAYKDNKKIQLPELGQNVNPDQSREYEKIEGEEVLYRIQVAATRQPANLFRIKGLKLDGRIVNIVQNDGWYKYTVGNFKTEAEAQDTLREMNNQDAFVVGYSLSGEEIKLRRR